MNEYYSKDLSKKVETGKHSIWAQGGFSEGTPPYGYYRAKRKLTKELVDAFVSEIVFYDGNIEVKLLYDDFLKELLKVAEEREVSSNG